MLESPFIKYLGFIIAVIASVSGIFGWMDPSYIWAIAGIFGFANLAALRNFIESSGSKTFIIAGMGCIVSVLSIFEFIPLELFSQLMAVISSIGGITLIQAQAKAIK